MTSRRKQHRTRTRKRQASSPDAADVIGFVLRSAVALVMVWLGWRARSAERREEKGR